ncbi:MAG: bifunctional methylenetetrahydrofolate dehydrogenase/methenyltetrahydrofolate cyclohydrolase [Candidatus Omnitrophica bacterium]|nr:bifunctional methylenetetrahydrofolate dehydrogenase/methenyltetrahydrofolate cyclohydrolase [Candidatus Omnitrophota bacterium]
MGRVIETKHTHDVLKSDLVRKVKSAPPCVLASVAIGDQFSSGVYLASQERLAREIGIEYRRIVLGKDTSLSALREALDALNRDEKVTGICVHKPFPPGWKEEEVFAALDPRKDVEGMTPWNLGKLFSGEPVFLSPTVRSVLKVLSLVSPDLYGKKVTLIGFSTLIGKPLALLLGRRMATVTITHIATHERGDLPRFLQNAEIVISAAGVPELVKADWIRPEAVVIDVGTGRKDGKLCGDVEFERIQAKASAVTPVPGGVGKLTPLFLLDNAVTAARRTKQEK